MADVFDIRSSGKWSYTAEASPVLATTMMASAGKGSELKYAAGPAIGPRHDAAYWDRVTAGFNFAEADQVPPALFNRVLWAGLMDDKPYPIVRGEASSVKTDD
jgi:hypothetical protein